ncbi:hypothetical protein J2W37_000785 [Variovorax paradoxus]|uniref:hypothetical protein n=1 Tax=Variovorax paradoxus TaxID=34073 RepID=UPI00277E0162|nr:hypothetical protein [Variovorax paradoxus]MDP9963079.1 hypothetical protein [Variovorax paradoxus]
MTNVNPAIDTAGKGQTREETKMMFRLSQLCRRGLLRQKDALLLMTTLTALSSWLVFWFGE